MHTALVSKEVESSMEDKLQVTVIVVISLKCQTEDGNRRPSDGKWSRTFHIAQAESIFSKRIKTALSQHSFT